MGRKRFTDADKWEDPWFCEQTPALKLFWLYLCDRCDHGGVWQVNWKLATFHLGALDHAAIRSSLGSRVVEIDEGRKWFLPGFISFQYPTGLSQASPAHKRIRATIASHGVDPDTLLYRVRARVVTTPEDKDVDEDKDRDKESLPDEHDIAAPSSLPPGGPVSDRDHWRMHESLQAWSRSLKSAMCKIGPENWRAWQAVVTKLGLPGTLAASEGVPVEKRWPDAVLALGIASRGQQTAGNAVAHKIIRMTL